MANRAEQNVSRLPLSSAVISIFIYDLFESAFNSSGCMRRLLGGAVTDGLQWMWKEVVVAQFNALHDIFLDTTETLKVVTSSL
jgi:hypothetical protein